MQHAELSYYNDLDSALGFAFGQIARGVADRRAAFHVPVIATVGADGWPSTRTVVARHFDQSNRIWGFHTDSRSAKYADLQRDPRIAVHFYDAQLKLQLRVTGHAALFGKDETAKAAWDKSRSMSRACYAQLSAPGATLETPDTVHRETLLDDTAAFANFTVVRVTIASLEWLYLASAGHRRARFTWTGTEMRAEWLAP